MALVPAQKRALIARAHQLQATVTIAADHLSESAIQHIRSLLSRQELAKVRIRAGRREECDQAAMELARQVPCELVARIGRVVLLYRPKEPHSGSQGGSVL